MLEIAAPPAAASLLVELQPPYARAKVSATCLVKLTNPAGAPVRVRLSASDPEGFLTFDLEPPDLTVEPSATASSELRVRVRRRRYVLGDRSRPFEVLAVPEAGAAVGVGGTFVQRRYLPLLLIPVAGFLGIVVTIAALLVLLLLVAIVWSQLS